MRASGGDCLQVGDDEVLDALRQALAQGLFIEPTSAVALAGLTQLQQRAASEEGLGTAVVLTGSGLKSAAQIEARITCASRRPIRAHGPGCGCQARFPSRRARP